MLFCDIWKVCIMSRKILVCPKNFWTPKMVHCPKFFWRRGGGGGGRSSKNIFRIANTFVASYAMKYSEIFFVIRKFFAYTPPTIHASYGPAGGEGRSRTFLCQCTSTVTYREYYELGGGGGGEGVFPCSIFALPTKSILPTISTQFTDKSRLPYIISVLRTSFLN